MIECNCTISAYINVNAIVSTSRSAYVNIRVISEWALLCKACCVAGSLPACSPLCVCMSVRVYTEFRVSFHPNFLNVTKVTTF